METKLKIIAEIEMKHKGIHLREISRLVNSGLPNVKRLKGGLLQNVTFI